ncbi:Casein kinase I [Aphelenchoides besseyi]|nr:Casein kinase I [Aphelenchoides besseyi]
MLTRDKEGKDRIRLIRCAHASEVTPLPMWKPDDGVKYTFGNVLRKSTDGKSRVFVGTRVDEEEDDEKHKIVAKLVLKGDNMAISAFREARVWSLLQRYSPFFRLHPPIELLPPNRLVFPRLSLSLAQIREHGPFGIETTLRLGLEMLAAIRELHDYAFVHRNVTPNHFLLHPSNSPSRLFRGLVLIDLAQASPYVSFNPLHGAVPDTVAHPNLVFASPHFNTDELHVMGRRDDLFSWFIIKQKQTATTSSINQTCKLFGPVCGDLMAQVAGHLNGLQVEQMPRYARFYRQFVRSLEHVGGNGQLSSYSDNVRVASENIFGPLKAAIVHPPRFTYWAQHNKHDVDYGKISAEFRASYDETVDNREFTLLEAKANVNRFEYAERHLKVEKRAAVIKTVYR